MRYLQQISGEWVEPKDPWRIKCCDCGLVHDLYFRTKDGKLQVMVMRNERATAAVRRVEVVCAAGSELHRRILNALNAISCPTDPIGLSRKDTAFRRLRGLYIAQAREMQRLRAELRAKGLPTMTCSVGAGELHRRIAGGLKNAIHAHGPIRLDNLNSAIKRVLGNIKQQFSIVRVANQRGTK